ncbi:MAG: DegT/DnrJ/EryC1/StrS family aminotransferase [Candidatus Rokuibacteriota bacterium]
MSSLALLGGPKTRTAPFPPYPVIGAAERWAVMEVLDEGRLSTFIASPGEHFLGGRRIRQFEQEFGEFHRARFAVAFNSATAALHAAVVACGVEPGQEVIVPPYTFTSTATCALMQGAIPVFADVDGQAFCLDPKSVEAVVSPLSRAMIPVHLFGQPAAMDELLEVARRHRLRVIEDCAQAPGATYRGKKVGTLGDCGVFSFQETKNLMTGEGGMLITDDPTIAEVARLIRNHGEAAVPPGEARSYKAEILGWNYRMTELEAALGLVQLRQLPAQNGARQRLAAHLTRALAGIPGLRVPPTREECEHVYYVYPLLYDEAAWGIPRARFVDAVTAEGIPISGGYVKPLYLSPLYQERRAWAFRTYRGAARYEEGICPVVERLHNRDMLLIAVVRPPATERDIDDIAAAIGKVWEQRRELG